MAGDDATRDGAYWKARGFVREQVKAQDGSVAFEPFPVATVELTGTNVLVTLPGTLFRKDGTVSKMTWKVTMGYDVKRKERRLPGR